MARRLRRHQIDLHATTVYHVVSRCTRALHLLADQPPAASPSAASHKTPRRVNARTPQPAAPSASDARPPRKDWILRWLRELATHFALEVVGFAIMDNHVHVLVHLRPKLAERWSPREVARRWLAIHPPRNGYMQPITPTREHLDAFVADPRKIAAAREKLASLSQFMKDFKQRVAERANREDGVTGSFWEGRYQCKPVFDEAQLLATLCYIDLNPFAAGACDKPDAGAHTSVKTRAKQHTKPQARAAATTRHTPRRNDTSRPASRWLTPMRRHGRGLLAGMTLPRYLQLLHQTARLLRPGKHRLHPSDTRPIAPRFHATPATIAISVRQLFELWAKPNTGLGGLNGALYSSSG